MTFPAGLGSIIAIVVLVLCVVLAVVNQGPLVILGLIGALAIARLT
jgi:hypothetical protein